MTTKCDCGIYQGCDVCGKFGFKSDSLRTMTLGSITREPPPMPQVKEAKVHASADDLPRYYQDMDHMELGTAEYGESSCLRGEWVRYEDVLAMMASRSEVRQSPSHVTSAETQWRYEVPMQRGAKTQLLTKGGISVTGQWAGELGEYYFAWAPLIKRDRVKEAEILAARRNRTSTD